MSMSKLKLKDYLNIKNVKNYIAGHINYLRRDSYFVKLPSDIQEQALYRASLCLECYKSDACIECGCGVPQLFYAPDKVDAKGRWNIMLDKDEWEKYKFENGIDIKTIEMVLDKHTKVNNKNTDYDTKG